MGRVDPLVPGAGQNLDIEVQHVGSFSPAKGKAAGFQHEHLVATLQRVAQGGIPGSMTVGCVDVGLAFGPEQTLQTVQAEPGRFQQRAFINVHCRPVHGPQDFLRHIGRSWNHQKFFAIAKRHGRVLV